MWTWNLVRKKTDENSLSTFDVEKNGMISSRAVPPIITVRYDHICFKLYLFSFSNLSSKCMAEIWTLKIFLNIYIWTSDWTSKQTFVAYFDEIIIF